VRYTYGELLARAKRVSEAIGSGPGPARPCAIWGSRSVATYASILGALLSGRPYVPLNRKFPPARNQQILQRSGAEVLVVDAEHSASVQELLAEGSPSVRLLVIDAGGHLVDSTAADMPRAEEQAGAAAHVPPSEAAYILFTSGSTGGPKGIAVSNRNAACYIRNILSLFPFTEADRFTQLFDFTFDLSVHDLFVCWAAGACLYVPPESQRALPNDFVREHELTVWFSVPSVAMYLDQLGQLSPGGLPTLKWSLFCGEALPTSLAVKWLAAAPASRLFNLYGPTEATIAFTWYEVRRGSVLEQAVIPIGQALPGQEVGIFDEDLRPVAPGESGELCLSGEQVTAGYLHEPERTAAAFIPRAEGHDEARSWYRTGDLASWDERHGLLFKGRKDRQLKLRGYRVELQEIETVLRSIAGTEFVAVLPDPLTTEGVALGVVAYGSGLRRPPNEVINECRRRLPDYMVPSQLVSLPVMPLNANGKLDYPQLKRLHSELTAGKRGVPPS
jgi:amino acid adenylation domain-containing protein